MAPIYVAAMYESQVKLLLNETFCREAFGPGKSHPLVEAVHRPLHTLRDDNLDRFSCPIH